MQPTRAKMIKWAQRKSVLNAHNKTDVMKFCYYTIVSGQETTRRKLYNFGVSDVMIQSFVDNNILSLMKDGKTYWFNAFDFCKKRAEEQQWNKELEERMKK